MENETGIGIAQWINSPPKPFAWFIAFSKAFVNQVNPATSSPAAEEAAARPGSACGRTSELRARAIATLCYVAAAQCAEAGVTADHRGPPNGAKAP